MLTSTWFLFGLEVFFYLRSLHFLGRKAFFASINLLTNAVIFGLPRPGTREKAGLSAQPLLVHFSVIYSY